MTGADVVTPLREELERRFRTVTRELELAGRTIRLFMPASAEELIDEADFDRDERLPYWADLWPSARVLALAMHSHAIEGKRILEIGAGLALASLVIHRRAGDVTVTDWHPLTEAFLHENLLANGLGPLPYQPGNWALDDASGASGLGRFDLIIGSDVLYERQQPAQLARFIDQHASAGAEIIIVDPDRGNRSAFCQAMATLGYGLHMQAASRTLESGEAYKGRFLTFTR